MIWARETGVEDSNQKRVFVILAAFVVVSAVTTYFLWRFVVQDYEDSPPFQEIRTKGQLDPELASKAAVYVVAITTSNGRILGSGFFVYNIENKTEWFVATNHHVVESVDSVSVYWPESGQQIENVEVLVSDKMPDIAILDAKPELYRISNLIDGLEHLKEAGAGIRISMQRPRPETPTFTFGFPNSSQGHLTRTTGTVAERMFYEYCGGQPEVNWIATDNETGRPGFSGGPLFTFEGTLIGMNSCGPEDEYRGLSTPMEEIQGLIGELSVSQ